MVWGVGRVKCPDKMRISAEWMRIEGDELSRAHCIRACAQAFLAASRSTMKSAPRGSGPGRRSPLEKTKINGKLPH